VNGTLRIQRFGGRPCDFTASAGFDRIALDDNGVVAAATREDVIYFVSPECQSLGSFSRPSVLGGYEPSMNDNFIELQTIERAQNVQNVLNKVYRVYNRTSSGEVGSLVTVRSSSKLQSSALGLGDRYGVYVDSDDMLQSFSLLPPYDDKFKKPPTQLGSWGTTHALSMRGAILAVNNFDARLQGTVDIYRIREDGSFQQLKDGSFPPSPRLFVGGAGHGDIWRVLKDDKVVGQFNRLVSQQGPVALQGGPFPPGVYNFTINAYKLTGHMVQTLSGQVISSDS
jgi:hypothetical protein